MRLIKLTKAWAAEPVYVAAENVTFVTSTPKFWNVGGHTMVHFAGGQPVAVAEPVEAVIAALRSGVDAKAVDDLG